MLARVCNREGVEFEPNALSLVCVSGDFVPRKSLAALEQVVREKQFAVCTGNQTNSLEQAQGSLFDLWGIDLIHKPLSETDSIELLL